MSAVRDARRTQGSHAPAGNDSLSRARVWRAASSSCTASSSTAICGARSSHSSPNDARCITPDWPLGSHEIPLNEERRPLAARPRADHRRLPRCARHRAGRRSSETTPAAHSASSSRRRIRTECARSSSPTATRSTTSRPRPSSTSSGCPHVPGAVYLVAQSMRIPFLPRSSLAFGGLSKTRVDDEVMAGWIGPAHAHRRRAARCRARA